MDGGANDQCGLQLSTALCTGTADGHCLSILAGEQLHGHAAGCARALGADSCSVGYADGEFGVRIVENHSYTGPRQTLLIVLRSAADPLDAGHIVFAADISRHSIDTAQHILVLRSGAPTHHALAGNQHVALFHQNIGTLYIVNCCLHISGSEPVHIRIIQK